MPSWSDAPPMPFSRSAWVSHCWRGSTTASFEACCDLRKGPRGDESCWEPPSFTFEQCCVRDAAIGILYTKLISCGKRCEWATPQACWNMTRAAELASKRVRSFTERCLEHCCGGLPGFLARAALRRSSVVRAGGAAASASESTKAPPQIEALHTARQCHLHAASALFCQYEHLCLARRAQRWSLVFLRAAGSSGSNGDVWTPVMAMPREASYSEVRTVSVLAEPEWLSEDAGGGAMSLLLPSGFWWPSLDMEDIAHVHLRSSRFMEQAIVGWSQPAADTRGPGQAVDWIGYSQDADADAGFHRQPLALFLSLDPGVAPRNLFHFAQVVLPVLSARLRIAWRGGAGTGSGLLEPLPVFDHVMIMDPDGASHLPWHRGLLNLVTGGATNLHYLELAGGSDAAAQRGMQAHADLRCFRRVVLPGMGRKDRAVPTSGRADHAALLVEAARLVPNFHSRVLGHDVIYIQRAPGSKRTISNEDDLLRSMRCSIYSLTGQSPCVSAKAPCLRIHSEDLVDFAAQVRVYSSTSLLVGLSGAGLTNMIFMPPESVVVVMQMVGSRDYYASMAHGCGHYAIPFFVECAVDPRAGAGSIHKMSARACKEDTICVSTVNNFCLAIVQIKAFAPVFAAAFSYAFARMLERPEWSASQFVGAQPFAEEPSKADCVDVEPPANWTNPTCALQLSKGLCSEREARADGMCEKTCGICSQLGSRSSLPRVQQEPPRKLRD